jgi:hypothetical protein
MRITRTLVMLALVTVMAVTTAATALAQAPAPAADPAATTGAANAQPHKVRGLVTAMSERGFRVKSLKGDIETVVVTDNTRFRLPGHKDITFTDLKIGDKVMVLGHKSADDVFTARLVNIEPRRPQVREAAGTVTAASSTSLTLDTLRGEKVTFVINDKTRIVPKDTVIKVGDKVAVVGAQAWGEKEIVAKVITVKRNPAPKPI